MLDPESQSRMFDAPTSAMIGLGDMFLAPGYAVVSGERVGEIYFQLGRC